MACSSIKHAKSSSLSRDERASWLRQATFIAWSWFLAFPLTPIPFLPLAPSPYLGLWFQHSGFCLVLPSPSSPSPPDKPAPTYPISTCPSLQAAVFSMDSRTSSLEYRLSLLTPLLWLSVWYDYQPDAQPFLPKPSASAVLDPSSCWICPNPIPALAAGHDRPQSLPWHESRFNAPSHRRLVHPPESCNTTTNSFQTFSSAIRWLFPFATQTSDGRAWMKKVLLAHRQYLFHHPLDTVLRAKS